MRQTFSFPSLPLFTSSSPIFTFFLLRIPFFIYSSYSTHAYFPTFLFNAFFFSVFCSLLFPSVPFFLFSPSILPHSYRFLSLLPLSSASPSLPCVYSSSLPSVSPSFSLPFILISLFLLSFLHLSFHFLFPLSIFPLSQST